MFKNFLLPICLVVSTAFASDIDFESEKLYQTVLSYDKNSRKEVGSPPLTILTPSIINEDLKSSNHLEIIKLYTKECIELAIVASPPLMTDEQKIVNNKLLENRVLHIQKMLRDYIIKESPKFLDFDYNIIKNITGELIYSSSKNDEYNTFCDHIFKFAPNYKMGLENLYLLINQEKKVRAILKISI